MDTRCDTVIDVKTCTVAQPPDQAEIKFKATHKMAGHLKTFAVEFAPSWFGV